MPLPTQPLRDEHRDLLPLLEQVLTAANLAEEAGSALDGAYEFLSKHLLPHAIAEEEALYPAVARAMGSPDATRTMEVDHAEVKRLVDELGRLRENLIGRGRPAPDQVRELHRVLYGLYTLVKVHFAKEEEVYLPLLDQSLSTAEAAEMFEAMEAAAARAKRD
ncbi:MAG TPA: hemerythrin domain-containing protein [Dehalococcoidia bacterium]|nr:hemerythrin domain-containing protein [Dehalococcoidia bacterium]